MYENYKTAFYDEGADLTGHATSNVTGGRFVRPSATKQPASQGLASNTIGGNIPAAHCGAGQKALGVAVHDALAAGPAPKFPIARGTKVFPVESGAAMAAGDPVASDATGRAITATGAAIVLGMALSAPTGAGIETIVALNL